jgi:hypothetical protein
VAIEGANCWMGARRIDGNLSAPPRAAAGHIGKVYGSLGLYKQLIR